MNRELLEKPFDKNQIKQREGNFGKMLDYIKGHSVIQRLNDAFDADWSFAVLKHEIFKETDEVIVLGELSAGPIIKTQFGASRITRGRGLVEIEDIEPKLASIKDQKKAIKKNIEHQKASQGVLEVSDDDIRNVIENFTEVVSHADAKVRKSAILALFEQISIFPKEGELWERILEIKGGCLPLTRVSVASPTGFEPVLPA